MRKRAKREKLGNFDLNQHDLMTHTLQILLVINAILSILEKIKV